MPRRRPRIKLAGLPQYIVRHGINREACFFAEEDYYSYLHLKDSRLAVSVSGTQFVRRRESGAHGVGQEDQENQIALVLSKRRISMDFEQKRMTSMIKRKNNSKLTPLIRGST